MRKEVKVETTFDLTNYEVEEILAKHYKHNSAKLTISVSILETGGHIFNVKMWEDKKVYLP